MSAAADALEAAAAARALLPEGVAVDRDGRWWLLPGYPMPSGVEHRWHGDDEWRTVQGDSLYPAEHWMTVPWSHDSTTEIRPTLTVPEGTEAP